MIKLHKMNGEEFCLNWIHIELIEEKPDTVITLTNEKKYLVLEKTDEIVAKIKNYNKEIHVDSPAGRV